MIEDVRKQGSRLPGRGPFGRLDSGQLRSFREALLDAFGLNRFDDMLLFYLGLQRQRIALGQDLETIYRLVIQRAEEESWTAELLRAARIASPTNGALFAFAQQFGLAPASPQGIQLEQKIRDSKGTLDIVRWRTRIAEIEAQVCRFEINSGWPPTFGTGFLVSADAVLTNYHVLEPVITQQISPGSVSLRFDYKRRVDGVTTGPGTIYHLVDEPAQWLIDSSPYSVHDLNGQPDAGDPELDELDYALVHVDGAPGNDPVGGPESRERDENAPARGWIVPRAAYDFPPESSVFIVQHPEGEPLQLALDTQSLIELNGNRTRVRYSTTTAPGSSGSPCFDADWNLIALHHSGDPRYDALRRPEYNQGIPMMAITTLLKQRRGIDLLDRSKG